MSVTSADVVAGSCPIVITRTYTVADACGNSVTLIHTINIDDITPPVVTGTLTPAVVQGCAASAAPAPLATVAAIEALPGGVTINDACSTDASMSVTSADVVAGSCPIVITRTYTVADACGNSVTLVHTINIDDITPPVVTGTLTPAVVQGCAASAAPAPLATVAAIEALPGGVTINDACSTDASMTVTSADVVAGSCPIVITRTYTVADACGNSVTLVHTINIDDITPPVVTGTLTPAVVQGCAASAAPAPLATVAAIEALPGGVTINDACSTDASMTVTSADVVAGSCPIVITRTYTVADACGNSVTLVHTINIDDITPPVVTGTLTPAVVQGCAASAAPAPLATVAAIEALPGGVTINDACSTDASMSVTSADVVAGSCPIVITRTYTVADACGNSVTLIHTINIDDITPPVVTGTLTPAVVQGCAASAAPAPLATVAAIEALPGGVTINDACSTDASMSVTSADVVAGSCPIEITRVLTQLPMLAVTA